jgi:hypothetical protein
MPVSTSLNASGELAHKANIVQNVNSPGGVFTRLEKWESLKSTVSQNQGPGCVNLSWFSTSALWKLFQRKAILTCTASLQEIFLAYNMAFRVRMASLFFKMGTDSRWLVDDSWKVERDDYRFKEPMRVWRSHFNHPFRAEVSCAERAQPSSLMFR